MMTSRLAMMVAALAVTLAGAADAAEARKPPACAPTDKACLRAEALRRERTSTEAARLRGLDAAVSGVQNRAADDRFFTGPSGQERLQQGLNSGLGDFKSDLQRMDAQRSQIEGYRHDRELQLNGAPGPLLTPP